jgi:hypothetical protein
MEEGKSFEEWSKAYEVAPLNSVPRTRELLGGCGHDYLYKLVNAGKLTIRKLGSRSFVTGEEIFKLVRELPAAGDAEAVKKAGRQGIEPEFPADVAS